MDVIVRTKSPVNGKMHSARYADCHPDDAIREFINVYAADNNIAIDEENIIAEVVEEDN